jgi:hypothetical protein
VGRASTDGLPLTVPSRVPPMRVQAQLTPCEYSEYPNVGHSLPREYLVRATKRECAGSITMPERPVRALQLRTPPTAREDSRLRCAAVQRARRRPLTAPARPPTPLRVRRRAHAGTPSTAPSHLAARDIDRDIVQRGDPPRPRDALPLGGRPAVPRALEVLGREGTRHTLAALRDLVQVLTVPRVPRAPNVRTTDRDVSWQLYCPM